MTLWFGEAWPSPELPAPVCVEAHHVPTPEGQDCLYCDVGIKPGDRGVLMPYVAPREVSVHPVHLGCLLMSIGVVGTDGWPHHRVSSP